MLPLQPKKRPHYSKEDIRSQLNKIQLIDFDNFSNQDDTLDQLSPIIKNILESQQESDYIAILDELIEIKDKEIENECKHNYQVKFISLLYDDPFTQ